MKNPKKTLFFFSVLCIGAIMLACSNDTTSGGGKNSGPITVTVKYQLTGTVATADVTYKNSAGGNDSLTNVSLPWEKSISVTIKKVSGFAATIVASSNTGGSLTAKIFVDGSEKKSASSSGNGYFTVSAVEAIMNY